MNQTFSALNTVDNCFWVWAPSTNENSYHSIEQNATIRRMKRIDWKTMAITSRSKKDAPFFDLLGLPVGRVSIGGRGRPNLEVAQLILLP